jgi:hypothetical protein
MLTFYFKKKAQCSLFGVQPLRREALQEKETDTACTDANVVPVMSPGIIGAKDPTAHFLLGRRIAIATRFSFPKIQTPISFGGAPASFHTNPMFLPSRSVRSASSYKDRPLITVSRSLASFFASLNLSGL